MLRLHEGLLLSNTYQLIQLIGSGGMGEVWRAQHMRMPEFQVAVKVIYHHQAQLTERLKREARVMAGLQHPHIVQVFDLDFLEGGSPFMVMELLKGTSLTTRIQERSYTNEQALSWIYQIGDALHTAHEHGIVHRDLKPDNLFISLDQSVKVLDFGISKIESMSVISLAGHVMGTPFYMSPEQMRGEVVDRSSDQFSLALILYELLVGERLVSGSSLPEVTHKLLNLQLPQQPSIIPDPLWDCLRIALSSHPSDRFSSIKEWVERLCGRELPYRAVNPKFLSSQASDLEDTLASGVDNTQATRISGSLSHPSSSSQSTSQTLQSPHIPSNSMSGTSPTTTHPPSASSSHSRDSQHDGIEPTSAAALPESLRGFFDFSPVIQRISLILLVCVSCVAIWSFTHSWEADREIAQGLQVDAAQGKSDQAHTQPLSERYQSAIESSVELPSPFTHWAPLILLKEHIRRFDNPFSQKLSENLKLLEKRQFVQFEARLGILLTEHDPYPELNRLLQATYFLSLCQHDAFKAASAWCQLKTEERALVIRGMDECSLRVQFRSCDRE